MGRSTAAEALSAKTLARPTQHPNHPPEPKKPHHLRRRVRSPAFRGGYGGRRSGPATPLLRWKFNDSTSGPTKNLNSNNIKLCSTSIAGDKTDNKQQRRNVDADMAAAAAEAPAAANVSARRLAAALWQLQLPELNSVNHRGPHSELVPEHLQTSLPYNLNVVDLHSKKKKKNGLVSPITIHHPENGIRHKLGDFTALSNCAMEKATKWDPGSKELDEVYRLYGGKKLTEHQQGNSASIIRALQSELEHARAKINELDADRRSARKKLDHFLNKLQEEKASWRSREHEKVRAIIEGMKSDLNRERKNRQRLEIVNAKLVNELAEAKLSAKRFMQDYEKERKARELMEEVCDELAKEIGEDKAEVEAIKRESIKIREEVEEERKMLQMAEVWREERVQMKLIDAKVTLDEKYTLLSKLQAEIEAFLGSQSSANPTPEDIKEAELLKDAVSSVKIHDIKEFTYQPPPASEDIYSIFEELQAREEPNEREIEQCYGYSPTSHASNMHTVSPDINDFLEKPKSKYANGTVHRHADVEDDSGWETVSHIEEEGSSNSPDGSYPSVNGKCRDSNASISGTDWDENDGEGNPSSEISEVCSVGTKQSRKKVSAISRLWRSSHPSSGENYKKPTLEAVDGRLSNGRMSNATLSPDRRSGEGGFSPDSLGQWSSPDSVNPHIARGMKGCIEWPRGSQKHSLKSKLLEARVESQKVQLRQVLKQKI